MTKSIRPHKRETATQKKVKKTKASVRSLQHKTFGPGVVLGTFETAAGGLVADLDFNGTRRSLSLEERYWVGDVADLLAAMPPQSRSIKPESKSKKTAEPDADNDEAEPELELVSGHLVESAEESEDPDDGEDVESQDGELVSV
jgi:hypothetical protein